MCLLTIILCERRGQVVSAYIEGREDESLTSFILLMSCMGIDIIMNWWSKMQRRTNLTSDVESNN